jgi:hypothetical protein
MLIQPLLYALLKVWSIATLFNDIHHCDFTCKGIMAGTMVAMKNIDNMKMLEVFDGMLGGKKTKLKWYSSTH